MLIYYESFIYRKAKHCQEFYAALNLQTKYSLKLGLQQLS